MLNLHGLGDERNSVREVAQCDGKIRSGFSAETAEKRRKGKEMCGSDKAVGTIGI
jgi:hypothetical protein